jgi:D-tyrosyl-tRNA(Tyr) deacylase
MRAVIQRVSQASVLVEGELVGSIKAGFLVLLAIKVGDTKEQALKLAEKIANLRILEDDNGKMNLSLLNQGGEVLLVSQFTLYGDTERGNRPSFIDSARPEEAEPLIQVLAEKLESLDIPVAQGSFGKYMQVELINIGPTTIIIDI